MNDTEAPYYIEGWPATNEPGYQISQLVRNRSDARRLLVPIRMWAYLSEREGDGRSLKLSCRNGTIQRSLRNRIELW